MVEVVDGGGQKGEGIPLDCIPPHVLLEVGKVYAHGAQKYAKHNWARGYAWSKSYAALQRHLNYWYLGNDYDGESGLSHLAHALWHCIALLYWSLRPDLYSKYDDRPFK